MCPRAVRPTWRRSSRFETCKMPGSSTLRHSHLSSTLTLVQSDRRTARRFTVDELQWLEHVRLQYGPSVSLIDLSTGGASFEAERPLRPGAATVLELGAEHEQRVVAGRIIRFQGGELAAT